MRLLKPSSRHVLIHTYVINGDALDYLSIENALRRNNQFEINRPWLNKQYLGIYRNRTYLLLFITVLVRRIFADSTACRFDLVNISKERLLTIFNNDHKLLSKVLEVLLAAEVIRFNPTYKPGEFSQSYGLPRKFKGQKLGHVALPEVDTSFYNTSRMLRKKIIHIKDDLTTEQAIIANIKKTRLHPDIKKFADSYSYRSSDSRDSNLIWLGNNYPMLGADISDSRREFDLLRFEYHQHIGRVFHNFTNSPKIFRPFLRYNNRRLVQLDIKAAHPFLLLNWYQYFERTWANYDLIIRQSPELKHTLSDEIQRYQNHVASEASDRDFYFWLGNEITASKEGVVIDRGRIKKSFYKFLFGPAMSNTLLRDLTKRRKQCPITDIFEEKFPLLLRTIEWHKTHQFYSDESAQMKRIKTKLRSKNSQRKRDGKASLKLAGVLHKQFAYKNQCLEGEAMVRGVCHDLARREGFYFLPIHDAIICQKKNEKVVRKLMTNHWRRCAGFAPVIVTTKL